MFAWWSDVIIPANNQEKIQMTEKIEKTLSLMIEFFDFCILNLIITCYFLFVFSCNGDRR